MTHEIEQLNPNIFRVHRTDLRQNPDEVYNTISEKVGTHFSCLIVASRKQAYKNGSGEMIEQVENDYRTHALIVTHPNVTTTVEYAHHQFEVITDRYGNVTGLTEPEYNIDLMTLPLAYNMILERFIKP